ncbi:MAG: hypothetical protein U0794_15630 [Isosphaeraceae bacterium]
MPTKPDKVIVTNVAALKAKYTTGYSRIDKALKSLVAADKARSIITVVVDLADRAGMTRLHGKAVTTPGNTRQVKAAVDAVYKALTPAYILILGSIDVVPHQDMKNPAYDPGADDDPLAPGDLPYACDHAYSQNPADFTAPTRVVGRVPDINGEKDPAFLVGLLETAASFKSRPATAYTPYLGVSADVWSNSTALSLQAAFGSSSDLQLAPPSGPSWNASLFGRLSHFFNCHGAAADPQWYGQKGHDYPVAHAAAIVAKNAVEGTVVAAECCYGAELYAPALTGGQAGISIEYLRRKAYGVFGSSTIAYGPASGNANADLICQYFFKHLLTGASLGRAALQARQDFVRSAAVLDPIDLKTLAQFSLLADPALLPVQPTAIDHSIAAIGKAAPFRDMGDARDFRRESLRRNGLAIGAVVASSQRDEKDEVPARIKKAMRQILENVGAPPQTFHSHSVSSPTLEAGPKVTSKAITAAFAPVLPRRIYVAYSVLPEGTHGKTKSPVRALVAVVARESESGLIFRTLYSR